MSARSAALRLGISVWLIYALHFAPNVVRETYLAITLGDRLSVRVDEYLGLHPDLFSIEGRGAYINNNPGASLLGAVPYAASRPFVALLFRIKPDLARPKPPSDYRDPRPNRQRFFNEARARGVDVKLGLAAAATQVGLMAPLGALAAVLMFFFLRARLGDQRSALGLALLYAFSTPLLFRSAFLNQNAIVAHSVLAAYVVMAGFRPLSSAERSSVTRLLGVGALLGFALLCDYSGAPLALAFGVWALVEGYRHAGPVASLRAGACYSLGAAGPIALLFLYQWIAFGHPLLPAQAYMPPTEYSVAGWYGLLWPSPRLLYDNLFDPHFGLFAFCPLLAAALFAPLVRDRQGGPTATELTFILATFLGLYLFNSANSFAFLQWNTGVRYMVPAVPLLFVALVPVLRAVRRGYAVALVAVTLAISWSVTMVREDVRTSVLEVLTGGLALPWLTTLENAGFSYARSLPGGVAPLPFFAVVAAILWLVWTWRPRAEPRVG